MPVKIKYNGFSLLEMSIVLVIVSVIVASGMVLFNKYSNKSDVEQTRIKIKEIEIALKAFAKRYNRLPCPADATLSFSDGDFGFEEFNSGGNTCTKNQSGHRQTAGMVPVSTLGLYPTQAVDSWGNRFTYIMLNNAAVAPPPSSTDIFSTPPYLRVKPYTAGSFSNAVIIIQSSGANGYGAYGGRGGDRKNSDNASAEELDYINAATQATATFTMTPPIEGFDDIVSFMPIDDFKSEKQLLLIPADTTIMKY